MTNTVLKSEHSKQTHVAELLITTNTAEKLGVADKLSFICVLIAKILTCNIIQLQTYFIKVFI